MEQLNYKIEQLIKVFSENSRYEAHKRVAPILLEMAKDEHYLKAIIKQNIAQDDFFNQNRINPVIAFKIFENKDFSFVAHAFMPLPDKDTTITHQSIHHHGNLLLSTVNCFGKGYESILFKKGYQFTDVEAKLEVQKKYTNTLYNYEFIDSHTPHVVYYPSEVTITYALWSSEKENATDGIKRLGLLKKYKKPVKKVIQVLGFEKLFNLNIVEYMDFYVKEDKVVPMKERIKYPEASNLNFIENLFYLLQQVNFENEDFLSEIFSNLSDSEKQLVKPILQKYLNNEELKTSIEDSQLNIAKVNLNRADLERIFKTA